MADPSLPSAPHSAIEAWTVCRDELALASQHLEHARATLVTWFVSMPVAAWKQPFLRDTADDDKREE